MSQPNTDPNVQNGLPYKWDGSKPPYGQYPLNNGLGGSSQSSRDSSPIPRFSNVPQSQLPPSRGQIPSSQLPPGRISVSPIIGQQSALKSASYFNTITPNSSPINTSTPIMRRTEPNSAGNILTGNNSLNVNTSLSSPSVPPTMPNDINVRNSRIPQTNGQSNKQNLNQPLLISNMEEKHTGNLLTNQLDQPMPAFVPVNTQILYPVPPNTKQENEEKPNLQSHFMNPSPHTKPTSLTHHLSSTDNKNQPQPDEKSSSTACIFPSRNEPIENKSKDRQDNSNENRIPNLQMEPNAPKPTTSMSNQPTPSLISASNPNVNQLGNRMLSSSQLSTQNTQSNMPISSQNGPQMPQNPFMRTSAFNNQARMAPNQNINQQAMPSHSQQGAQNMMYQQFQSTLPNLKPPLPPIMNQNQESGLPSHSTASQNLRNIPPMSMASQNLGNTPPTPISKQNEGNMTQKSGQPLTTQSTGFQPFQSIPSSQSISNSMSSISTANMGEKQQGPPQSGQSAGYQPPFNQSGPRPPTSNQSVGSLSQTQPGPTLGNQSGVMPPIANANIGNVVPNQPGPPLVSQSGSILLNPNQSYANMPPMPKQNMDNVLGPQVTSKSGTMPPLPNQNSGNVPQSLSGAPLPNPTSTMPPMPNQNVGFQQYATSQSSRQPTQGIGSFPPQNVGYQQYPQMTNQNAKPPTGNIYPPPMQGNNVPTSQYAYQNKPNEPSQNYPQMIPNTSMPPGSNLNQNKNQIQPPTGSYDSQKQENASYPSTPTSALHKNRYAQNYEHTANYTTQNRQNAPNQMYQQSYGQNYQNVQQGMSNMNLGPSGFNRLYGSENIDLLQCPNVLPQERIDLPKVCLGQECLNNANCSPEIFRCTMTKIPESNALLQKSRLPLGVLIHPFKDLNHLPVIQCSSIVRCRACRTYINPYVYFVDTKRWKCNLCYRVNDLPEEFQYDPVSKSYGDPSRRPEIKSSTIEYIAPSEYMLRPPQPAVYLFLLDVSKLAIDSGYLHTICEVLTSQLQNLPGDSRTQIGFIAYNSTLHFYSLGEGLSQPHEMTVLEINDVFLPCPDNLLVNLKERMELVTDLLALLPTRFLNSYDNGSALGAAIQAAFKLMSATGGRLTIFQCSLPTIGPGALTAREDPNQRAGKEAPHLNPATDFYKRMALECSGHQVAVDLFVLNAQYVDIATLSGISRFSGGCMHHFPLFKGSKSTHAESLEKCFKRYLTRKIGFEAVMRIRCTRGLAIHTFHGNFFVRSTDLLSLPNINPDAGFGMQVSIEESLSDLQNVCFQAALLYTSSKGERRIRVHTLALPVCNNLPEIINSADQQCIVGLLSKMAVDRSLQSSLSDARDAFINVAIDILHSYKVSLNMGEASGGLLASQNLKLLPMYILALLKHTAFRTGMSTRLDDRVFAMCEMKTLPLCYLIQQVYPDLYSIHNLTDEGGIYDSEGIVIPQPPRLQLTSRNIDGFGAYLMDCGQQMIIFVCQKVSPSFLVHVLGVPNFNSISDQFHELPKMDNPDNQRLHTFIASLNDEKPYCASLHIIRENSPNRILFLEKLIEDRMESALSYNEFLQHIKTQVK